MSVFRDARWRVVAIMATVCTGLASLTTLAAPVATEHAWALVVAVVAAALLRAACSGGVRSILCLVGAMVVAQPAMHLAVELTHSHDLLADHATLACLVLVASHVALFAVLTAVVAAGDLAGRAVVAHFRRLVRTALRTFASFEYAAVRPRGEAPVRRRKQRLGVCLVSRRGPPAPVTALS